MARRYYSSVATQTTLSSGINSSATTMTVGSTSGFPASVPYTLIIDQDQVTEEIVTVTAVLGSTLTVTRGVDGTTGVVHSAGATVRHGVSARDFDETNAHANDSSTDVHSQYILKSLLSSNKGTIPVGTGSAVAALAVGSNDTVAVADTSTATGIKWASLVASQIPSISSAKVPSLDISAQTGNYTLVLADAGKTVLMGSSSAQTLTIPTNSSVAFPVGTKIDIIRTGTGEADVAGAVGVTLNSDASKKKITAQYSAATLVKTATDTWVLIGALKA